jgi:hypothetical protein
MSSLKRDLEIGLQSEKKVLEIIRTYFNKDIQQSKYAYCQYDFKCSKYTYELKTRMNNYNTYPTTLIPYDKIKKKTIFLFKFNDGLYYIRYRKRKFKNYELKSFVRNKRIDFNDKPKLYYYIPIRDLKKIEY